MRNKGIEKRFLATETAFCESARVKRIVSGIALSGAVTALCGPFVFFHVGHFDDVGDEVAIRRNVWFTDVAERCPIFGL